MPSTLFRALANCSCLPSFSPQCMRSTCSGSGPLIKGTTPTQHPLEAYFGFCVVFSCRCGSFPGSLSVLWCGESSNSLVGPSCSSTTSVVNRPRRGTTGRVSKSSSNPCAGTSAHPYETEHKQTRSEKSIISFCANLSGGLPCGTEHLLRFSEPAAVRVAAIVALNCQIRVNEVVEVQMDRTAAVGA